MLLTLPWTDLALPESRRAPTGKHLFMLAAVARVPVGRTLTLTVCLFFLFQVLRLWAEGSEPPHARTR